MHAFMNMLVALSVVLCFVSMISPVVAGKKRVMTWLCLEFCQESQETIQKNIQQILEHKSIFDAVSFEKYTLGPNSTLVDNNLTVVSPRIVSMGLEAWPLLSSYPHPPEFIDWMRTVFKHPQPFIESCIREAHKNHYVGYNLDWEPTDDVVTEDGAAYAQFIDVFAKELHRAGLQLTVDIATWSPIWNYTMIANTHVDRGISMGTYTATDSSFAKQMTNLTSAFESNRAGVGLMTVNASSNDPLPLSEVQFRMDSIVASGATEIDIWSSPVPEEWFPLLQEFKNSAN